MNKVILVGRIGKMFDLKNAGQDNAVQSFQLATTDVYKKDDQFVENTEWHRVVCFGKVAQWTSTQQVGNLVEIEGSNRTRKYTDSNGVERYVTEVVIKAAPKVLHRKSSSGSASDESPSTAVPAADVDNALEDDIPF